MIVKKVGFHVNPKGTKLWKYGVYGTASEIAAYIETKGEHNRFADDGVTPLLFSKSPIGIDGSGGKIGISSKGRVFVDNSDIDTFVAIVSSVGGNPGQIIGDKLFDQMFGNKPYQSTTPKAVVSPKQAEPETQEGLDIDPEDLELQDEPQANSEPNLDA